MNQKPVNHSLTPEHVARAADKVFDLILQENLRSGVGVMDIALRGLKACMDEGNDNMIVVCKAVCKKAFEFERADAELDPHASMKNREIPPTQLNRSDGIEL